MSSLVPNAMPSLVLLKPKMDEELVAAVEEFNREPSEQTPEELREEGARVAKRTLERLFKDSTFLDLSKMLPAVDREEIKLGTLLGMGSFGVVFEVRGIKLDPEHQGVAGNLPAQREFLAQHTTRDNGDARYAVKKLTQQAISDPIKGRYTQAVLDMAIETRLLSNLDDHAHICKLRGVAASRDPYRSDYLLILDRLYDTLAYRIYQVWKPKFTKYRGMSTKWLVDRSGAKMKKLRQRQLLTGVQVCAALDHLHARRILFRDLKPENCGYDIRDDIKIFDFGLAKELKRELRVKEDEGMYNLTGMTGSPRYMAPEVANGVPYNENADAYSFAIMFYEMYSMSCPYENFTMDQMRDRVWNTSTTKRPFRPSKWPEAIRVLLKRGWTGDHHNRMTVVDMMEVLHAELTKLQNGEDDDAVSVFTDGGTFASPSPMKIFKATSFDTDDKPDYLGGVKKNLDRNDLRQAFRKRKSTFVFREANEDIDDDQDRDDDASRSSDAGLNLSCRGAPPPPIPFHKVTSILVDEDSTSSFDDDEDEDDLFVDVLDHPGVAGEAVVTANSSIDGEDEVSQGLSEKATINDDETKEGMDIVTDNEETKIAFISQELSEKATIVDKEPSAVTSMVDEIAPVVAATASTQ